MTIRLRRLAGVAVAERRRRCTRQRPRPTKIRVMTSGAFTAAYLELAAEFERRTGHRVISEATSMVVGDTSIPSRLGAAKRSTWRSSPATRSIA